MNTVAITSPALMPAKYRNRVNVAVTFPSLLSSGELESEKCIARMEPFWASGGKCEFNLCTSM